jgi:hypothetical protein
MFTYPERNLRLKTTVLENLGGTTSHNPMDLLRLKEEEMK